MHLLIPFAASHADGARDALARLQLPQLEQLLARLTLTHSDADLETSRSPPHERALARAWGLPVQDGMIPWAAWQARSAQAPKEVPSGLPAAMDAAWAWITLCHWHANAARITADDPQTLDVTPTQSQTLLESMRPYFAEDGITLVQHSAGRWLAHGELFRDLSCASLDRVIGRHIDAWMPQSAHAKHLHRLQNEMQMLLYTHPVNDERAALGQRPINSFWISGAGALPLDFRGLDTEPTALVMPLTLRDAAVREDWANWAQCWQALDAGPITQALQLLKQGASATLTLCGERSAQRFAPNRRSLMRRISNYFNRKPLPHLLNML